jgi:starch-binding outer membrane protein, SusD/RagB family
MHKRTLALLAALGIAGTACKDSTGVPDLNNISAETQLGGGLTPTTLQLLATGLVNASRAELDSRYIVFTETMARDFYRLDNAENRYITELIGGVPADYSAFTGSGAFTNMYVTIRSGNTILNNLGSAAFLSPAQVSATKGFVQTMKALAYYRVLETRDTLGIAFDVNHAVNDPPAQFECKPNVLAQISTLLDSANTNLTAAGTAAFPFALPSGFNGFSTPATFAKFNRGLKGKVELYRALPQGNRTKATGAAGFNAAIAAINASFVSTTGAMQSGPAYTFSTSAGDLTNPLADANIYLNPAVAAGINAADKRKSKILDVTDKTLSNVTGTDKATVTDPSGALTMPIPILTNAELLLLRAQAELELGQFAAATADVNAVRTTEGGLPTLATFPDKATGIQAVLYEKRYSLLGQSAQRLVDLREYGLLNASAGPGRSNGDIFQTVLPIPKSQFDTRNVTTITPACP